MAIVVYSLLWVMQDFDHQPYVLLYVIATRSGRYTRPKGYLRKPALRDGPGGLNRKVCEGVLGPFRV